MSRFNQDSQSDVSIKQRLVKLLKEDAKKFTSSLKVQGTTEANAKAFDNLEKALNTYKILLEEFIDTHVSMIKSLFSLTPLQKKTENITSNLNNFNSKIKRFGFDVLKNINLIKSKELTIGEIDVFSNYINDFEKMSQTIMLYIAEINNTEDVPYENEDVKDIVDNILLIYSNIINTTESIINQYKIIRNKTDLPQGTVFIQEPIQLSGAGYYPKRFH